MSKVKSNNVAFARFRYNAGQDLETRELVSLCESL